MWQRQRNCAALPVAYLSPEPRTGLVTSRQTFVRRCHQRRGLFGRPLIHHNGSDAEMLA